MATSDDAELEADPVGVASARLLATGVPRLERLGALRLLGILTSLADADRRVRRPLPDVAHEFDLPAPAVDRWADHLAGVGVLHREGTTTVLTAAEPVGNTLRLEDFLDAAAALDHPSRRPVARVLRPASAVLAAAAVLVALLAAPGMLHQRANPVSSSGPGANATTTTLAPGGEGRPARAGTPGSTAPAPAGVTAPSVSAPGSTPTTPPPSLPVCPPELPFIQLLGTTPSASQLTLHGEATNPSNAALRVDTIRVQSVATGLDTTVPPTSGPLTVPAHATVPWSAQVPVILAPGVVPTAAVGDWSWDASQVPSTCPSP